METSMKPSESSSFFTDTRILWLLALALFLLHMFTNRQYGFHQDELVVLDNANNLDWGFIEYPPLTPFLARIELTLFGLSLVSARTLSALAHGIVLVLTGLMARELDGRRWTQILAAVAAAIAPIALIQGSLIQYVTFDFLWSVSIAYSVIRLLKTEDPRWWLGIGALIGLGMMTRYTMVFFAAGLAGGVLLTDARRYLRSRWLWGGLALSLLIFLPNLLWMAQHDFISLQKLSAMHARDVRNGYYKWFLVDQLYSAANPSSIYLWVIGLYFFWRGSSEPNFRPLVWMYAVPLAGFLALQGRGYYLAPAYPMLIAGGAYYIGEQVRHLAPAQLN